MSLKQIEIQGFKSFADKTKLLFSPGITCIVGPNGCGKSNIADAFRWVFGEQSAKSMRGNKMHDVIFAGTNHRKPLNIAEVTITITNPEGALPTEFEEVAVTRRLHRNGESDYLINRNHVRMKDVQSLFLDSGIGKSAFSIFEQGKIDQVINLSPLERRYIFEEAAGILRFLQRKREALKKLEQADQNTLRVKDIHHEVERQIIVLEKQAEEARLFKENKASLEYLEKCTFVLKWDLLRRKSHEANQKSSSQRQQADTIQIQIDNLNKELLSAKEELKKYESTLQSRREEVYRVRSEKEIKSKERISQQDRIKESDEKEKRWNQELQSLQQQQQSRQQERVKLHEQQTILNSQLETSEHTVQKQREQVQALEVDLAMMREQQQRLHQEMLQKLQAESRIDSEMKQTAVRLETSQERLKRLEERKVRLNTQNGELKGQAQERKSLITELSTTLEQQKNTFTGLESRIQELTQEIQSKEALQDSLRQSLQEGKARHKALSRLRDDHEGFSKGSKRLLAESQNPKSPLAGLISSLYEHLVPTGDDAKELASILRPYTQTLVVKNVKDLETLLTYSKKNSIHDFSVLCLEKLTHASKTLKNLAKGLKEFVPSSDLMAHFTRGSAIGNDVPQALSLIQEGAVHQFVSQDGMVIDLHNVLFSSSLGEQNVFLREAELKDLHSKLELIEQQYREQEAAINALVQQRATIHQERSDLDKTLRRNEMKLVEGNFGLQKIMGEMEKAAQEIQAIDQDFSTLQEQITQLLHQSQEHAGQHTLAKTAASESQKNAQTASLEIDKHMQLLKGARTLLHEKESLYQKNQDEVRKTAHALHVLEIKDIESQHLEKRLGNEMQANLLMRKHVLELGSECDVALKQIAENLSQAQEATTKLEQQVALQKGHIDKIEGLTRAEFLKLKKTETDMNQLGIQTAQIDTSLKGLETELQERYHLAIDDAREIAKGLDQPLEEVEKRVKSLRQQLANAGDVNLASIEEFDKHKSRYEFLNQQIDDLEGSRDELIQIIAQLDGESRKIFKDTFETIRLNFQKNFQILFNGGEADLEFTESSDVLEAGIEITAKPPGKQMRSISLLSGGEKCLTALALLFAIFEVKPAPFCILDEIDAPLDDSNVERFLNVVRQFIDRCQFIIITHNKRTMAIADVLFGVSMEEKGVSKLLSLEFEHVPNLALV